MLENVRLYEVVFVWFKDNLKNGACKGSRFSLYIEYKLSYYLNIVNSSFRQLFKSSYIPPSNSFDTHPINSL